MMFWPWRRAAEDGAASTAVAGLPSIDVCCSRAILDYAEAWGRDGAASYTLWFAASFAVSDYGRNHFVTLGPCVELRVQRLAVWCGAAACPQPNEKAVDADRRCSGAFYATPPADGRE